MKGRLKSREITTVMTILIVVKIIFTYPRFLIEQCENNAWLAMLIYGAVALLIFHITGKLYMKTEKLSVISQANYLGGRLFSALTGILLILILMINIAPMVRAFPEAIKTALLRSSSMLFITSILFIGIISGVSFGIEAMSVLSSLFLPVAVFFILIFAVLLFPEYKITNLYPISFTDAVREGVPSLSVYSDIIVLNLLLKYCEDTSKAVNAGKAAIIAGTIISTAVTLMYCLIYPYPASARFIVPMYQMSRIVSVGTYFQRLESIFEFVWSISIFLYTSIYIYVMCDIFRHSFNLKEAKPLSVPVLIILLMLVFYEESYVKTLRASFVSSAVLFPVFYLLPLVYGSAYLIKKRKEKRL